MIHSFGHIQFICYRSISTGICEHYGDGSMINLMIVIDNRFDDSTEWAVINCKTSIESDIVLKIKNKGQQNWIMEFI